MPVSEGFLGFRDIPTLKIIIFWDITPCSPLKINRRFGGTYRFHLQAEQETSVKAGGKQSRAHSSTLMMEAMFLSNVG
jgi:hypothetical protein